MSQSPEAGAHTTAWQVTHVRLQREKYIISSCFTRYMWPHPRPVLVQSLKSYTWNPTCPQGSRLTVSYIKSSLKLPMFEK